MRRARPPLALLLTLAALALPGFAAEPEAEGRRLDALFESFLEEYAALHPTYATSIGDHRFNDRLTLDLLPEHRRRTAKLFAQATTELAAIDRARLDPRRQLYRDAFAHTVELAAAGLAFDSHLLPVVPGLTLQSRFPQMGTGGGAHPFRTVRDYDDFLSRIDDFVTWVDAAIGNMRRGMERGVVQPRSLIERALPELAQHFGTEVEKSVFYGAVERLPESFSAAERQRLTAAYGRAIGDKLMPAYERLHRFLKRDYLPACRPTISLSALPGGRDWYRYLVRTYTTTEMTPEEIFALGEREIQRIEGEMRLLQRRLQIQGNLREFRRRMAADPRATLTGRRAVLEGFDAIRRRVEPQLPRLFHLRPAAGFEIRPVEAFRAATAPGAFYEGPSADGSQPGTFYVNLRGRTYPKSTMEALFLHEALPGHHFQIALARERDDLPTFLRHGYYGAFTEGWGLYCEGLGRDLGLYGDPFQAYGRLTYDLGRASRLVADIGIHHRGWTRQEALAYLRRRDLGWAISEIDRYVAMPAQALAYKVGERRLLELRARAREALGEGFDLRRFHDAVLEDGPLPLAVLEEKIERFIRQERRRP